MHTFWHVTLNQTLTVFVVIMPKY